VCSSDLVSALLGLGYPGGPRIEKLARGGNPKAIAFPRGKPGDDGLQVSFSGLKTAVLYHMQKQGYKLEAGRPRLTYVVPDVGKDATRTRTAKLPMADLAASFQEAAVDMLVRAALNACRNTGVCALGLTGGVAANSRLREKLAIEAAKSGVTVFACPKELCTDNAAFIAGAAYECARAGKFDSLELDAVPN